MENKRPQRRADNRVAYRIRNAYLIAISIIAAVTIGIFVVERGSIERFDDVASVVNHSGKQRMLSQRIALYSNKLAEAQNEGVAALVIDELSALRTEFADNHNAIINLGSRLGNDDLTEDSLKIYYGGKYALDEQVRVFLQTVDKILSAEPYMRRTHAQAIEYAATIKLLDALDAAVSQFEKDAKADVVAAVHLRTALLIAIMLLLVAELVLIFRPLVDKIEARTRDLRVARDELEHAALHDQLTQLPNRRMLNEILKTTFGKAQRVDRPMTVCHLDLDYFKIINDTLGHAVGDAVLVHAAKVLRETVRSSDFVARVGGDEFVIIDGLLGGTTGTMRMAERIVENLSKPFEVDGHTCQIGASIGIAEHDDLDDPNLEAVLHRADIALYHAKELGRGRAVAYTDEAQDSFEERAREAA